jgi:hypothetical protein
MKELEGGDNELVNIYAEFGYKLKQIKEFYYRKLLNDELIRKELVKKDYHDVAFNPVFTLGLIDDKKAIEAEIIDIKKLMYINLVRLAFYLENRKPTNFITVLKPEDFVGRYSGSVKMFISRDDMQRFAATDLANFLWKNEFIDAIVETSGDSVSEELRVMLDKTRMANIFFTPMTRITATSMLPNVAADIAQIRQWNKDRVIGRHYELEISGNQSMNESEELVISDWLNSIPQNDTEGGIRLSIGIPGNMSINLLNRIFDKFDLVFVRERGMPDREKIQSTYSREISMDRDRLVLNLDGADFVDRMHVDNFMSNLHDNLGISNFAFSSYESMFHLDTRVINHTDSPESLIASIQDQIYLSESRVPEKTEVEKAVEKQEIVTAEEIVNQVVEEVFEKETIAAENVVTVEVIAEQANTEIRVAVESETVATISNDSEIIVDMTSDTVVETQVLVSAFSDTETINESAKPIENQAIDLQIVSAPMDSVVIIELADSTLAEPIQEQEEMIAENTEIVQNESVVPSVEVTAVYRIQIAASKVKLSENFLIRFKAEDIREIIYDGLYKYTIGNFSSERDAYRQLRIYKEQSGNTGAFIVTY